MTRALIEITKSIRIQARLSKQFWVEAINTIAYLINWGSLAPLEQIPKEVWIGKEVKPFHLKVFGCVSFVHISDHDREKLDAKSLKFTSIGYGVDGFGYKFLDD